MMVPGRMVQVETAFYYMDGNQDLWRLTPTGDPSFPFMFELVMRANPADPDHPPTVEGRDRHGVPLVPAKELDDVRGVPRVEADVARVRVTPARQNDDVESLDRGGQDDVLSDVKPRTGRE